MSEIAQSRWPKQGLYDPAFEHDACGVGFVANVRGEKSHDVVEKGIRVLENLEHRGACGCDPDSGDGAGLLVQIPDAFLRRELAKRSLALPAPGKYAVAMLFVSRDPAAGARQAESFERVVTDEGQRVLGWRDVPTAPETIGRLARAAAPSVRQLFIEAQGAAADDQEVFERKLYVIRRVAERAILAEHARKHFFYVPSCSSRTLVYTGMLVPRQIRAFYPDVVDPEFASAMCLVHSRYSTNTLGAWDLAHPFRYLAHNGEINTIKGNQNWMRAREGTLASPAFGDDLQKLFPIMRDGGSDSQRMDNVLEFLVRTGRELPEAILMMIPEAWENRDDMDPDLRAYYEFHSFLMEPYDGPADIAFSDGRVIGAVLDRNGLRPSRYTVTKDGFVVMASEVGVIPIAPENVLLKERLHPGRIFCVDLEQGRILDDGEIKRRYAAKHPYREWVEQNRAKLSQLPAPRAQTPALSAAERIRLQQVFGYTSEDLRLLLAAMGAEASGRSGAWARTRRSRA